MRLRVVRAVTCMLAVAGAALVVSVHAATPENGPWEAVWTMDLRDEERTYVDYGGSSYLVITLEDLDDPDFLDNKDVCLHVKFARVAGERPVFYHLDDLVITGGIERWGAAVDGDNYYVLGKYEHEGEAVRLQVEQVVSAPSDSQVIASRLGEVDKDDYRGRLAVADWARAQAEAQGNREFWLQAAYEIVRVTVEDAAAAAAAAKDHELLVQAMTWAIEKGDNRELAAEIGSAPWIRESGGEARQAVEGVMTRLGFVFHDGEEVQAWMPVGRSLTLQFEQRFASTDWRDARGYFELGRWADKHADVLPNARQLSHRAYAKGLQANPNNNDIRRALGLDPVPEGERSAARETDFTHPATNVKIPGPKLWLRSPTPIVEDASATWIDPGSDTAYLAATVLPIGTASRSLESLWDRVMRDAKVRTANFSAAGAPRDVRQGELVGRRLAYSYREASYQRLAELALLYNPRTKVGVKLVMAFVEDESQQALTAMEQVIKQVEIPDRQTVVLPGTENNGDEGGSGGE